MCRTTRSRSWCTRSRWCTRWSSSPTARRSPSSACPTCGCPIGYALGYPHRIATPFGRIDWSALRRLDFEPPDLATFRCLSLAYEAGRAGGTAPAWLSAANEVAVEAFLAGLISWNQIADVSVATLDAHDGAAPDTVDDVIAADAEARRLATRPPPTHSHEQGPTPIMTSDTDQQLPPPPSSIEPPQARTAGSPARSWPVGRSSRRPTTSSSAAGAARSACSASSP